MDRICCPAQRSAFLMRRFCFPPLCPPCPSFGFSFLEQDAAWPAFCPFRKESRIELFTFHDFFCPSAGSTLGLRFRADGGFLSLLRLLLLWSTRAFFLFCSLRTPFSLLSPLRLSEPGVRHLSFLPLPGDSPCRWNLTVSFRLFSPLCDRVLIHIFSLICMFPLRKHLHTSSFLFFPEAAG